MYFWEYFGLYPTESIIISSILILAYIGWIKKFWYLHKPSIYATNLGQIRVRRFVGRIAGYETVDGHDMLSLDWKSIAKEDTVIIKIYIRGQPIRRMRIIVGDIEMIYRVPAKLFKKEITIDKLNVVWNADDNLYDFTDDKTPIYIIKPHIFEKSMLKKIDNMDMKSSRGSKMSPPLIHSGYFNNHLPIPPDEYSEKDDLLSISEYAYSSKDKGGYGTYDDVIKDDEVLPMRKPPRKKGESAKDD